MQRNVLIKSGLPCLLIIMLNGCQRRFTYKELIGTYFADHEFGVELLNLLPNGTYNQWFAPNGEDYHFINMG